MRSLRAAAALFSLSLVVGCSAAPSSSSIRLSSQQTGERHSQAFATGVADVQEAGDADVVLTCQTESATTDAPAVRQVLHVHVLWQQGYRLKANMREIAQNASFHWYVFPAGHSDGAGQVVEYTGTGHVELERNGEQVTVRVVEAKLTPSVVTRRMNDPLGPTSLTGTLVARTDRRQTIATLNQLRATVAMATAPRAYPVAVEAKLPLGQ